GQELDPSTGYYYFGARYYDPKIQNWQSTDPILASYMRGGPVGGVFQPRNLGLYGYAWNSPAVVRDHDGRAVALVNKVFTKAESTRIEGGLQEGTDDVVKFDSGILQIEKRADDSKLKHPQGTKLLRRLIESEQTILLTKRRDKGFHH